MNLKVLPLFSALMYLLKVATNLMLITIVKPFTTMAI
ncbi:hypothetical protein MGSAQ_002301 [marine sediment metagenome]|uniref:Uncharacterized protein n=1 Tax=marine sediment metagenome TaxID=412755 RepID=A0A1B6NRW0_9ZZZZ